ncbi:MAG: hypothetical protein KAS32_20110 [Candidatus Peribacteraceae bacterium]|nr:hypothetical protein [Candidatus Peribacteraceae bacterium]
MTKTCEHKNYFKYDPVKWCPKCGALKPDNHTKWMVPSHSTYNDKSNMQLMKNRKTDDESD